MFVATMKTQNLYTKRFFFHLNLLFWRFCAPLPIEDHWDADTDAQLFSGHSTGTVWSSALSLLLPGTKKRNVFFFSLFFFRAGCVHAKMMCLAALISEDFQPCVERTDWEKFENADFNERTDTSDLNPQYFDCFALSPTLPSTDSSSAACSCNLFAGR